MTEPALTPAQQKLAAIAQTIGDRIAGAFTRAVEVKTWVGKMPEVPASAFAKTVPPVASPAPDAPRATRQDEPEQRPAERPKPPETRLEAALTQQAAKAKVAEGMTSRPVPPVAVPNFAPVMESRLRGRELSGGLTPSVHAVAPATSLTGGVPSARPSVAAIPLGMGSTPPVPSPVMGAPPRPPVAPPELRLAADNFRQGAMAGPLPAAGISVAPRGGGGDAPLWATELTAAIKELTREMGEADEDETEHGENQPRREGQKEPVLQIRRSERILPTVTAWQDRPSRPQPPMPSAGAPRP